METAQGINLAQMKEVDINTADRESLMDIRDVQVDVKLSRKQHFEDYLRQIKTPYCYRCGKIVVKVSFSDTIFLPGYFRGRNSFWKGFFVGNFFWEKGYIGNLYRKFI